ncbi:hypothetical protein NSERUTF1_0471 [Nocardia seriolae]|nr:hypothetical protein NSERUTF1_0471 [Nocardia seriolae]
MSGTDRGDVTAGTSAENNDIVVGSHDTETRLPCLPAPQRPAKSRRLLAMRAGGWEP